MKATTIVIALFLSFNFTLSAQTTSTWKGGAAGQEHEWNCPKNWSNHKVPDEFSNVVIPDVSTTTLAAPVIKNGQFEVNSILVHSNAKLTIEQDAQLVAYAAQWDCPTGNDLCVKGSLLIINEDAVGNLNLGFAKK